jgi:Protein of unknown function (DUF2911)
MRSLLIGAASVVVAGLGFSQFEGPPAGPRITDEPPAGVRPPQPPPLSPPARTSLTLDGQKITINYSAPSMRRRVIFGGLVPYSQVWRAGANDATLLHTSADLEFKGLVVAKGNYSLFVWPDPQQWQLIINQEIRQSGLEYHQERDLGRVAMDMSRPPKPIETYKITLTKTGITEGQLKMAWENTVATAGFVVRAPR